MRVSFRAGADRLQFIGILAIWLKSFNVEVVRFVERRTLPLKSPIPENGKLA
jgi:hypothetical protein